MTEQQFVIAPLYKGWDVYQQLLIDTIAPLSSDQLELQAAPHLRSVGMTVRHIIGARARWLRYVLHEGGEELIALGKCDRPDQLALSASELVGGLATTWQILQNALGRWTAADLDEELQDVDDETGKVEIFTRQWVIWHLIEHDLHHGGELSFILGMHHVKAIDL